MSSKEAVTVFYSYAHEDKKLRDELAKHLSLLKREGIIKEWHDRRIMPGDEWKNQIDHYLETAELILLLVSPDFMASDYCYDIEMQRALERHEEGAARVVPIILRPVDWAKARFAALQALPTDGRAVTAWPNRDKAFLNVTQGIRQAVEALRLEAVQPLPPTAKRPSLAKKSKSSINAGTVFQGDVKVNKGDVVFGNKIDQMNIDMSGRKKR